MMTETVMVMATTVLPAAAAEHKMTQTHATWRDLSHGTTNERGSAVNESCRLLLLHVPEDEWCKARCTGT